MPEVIVPEDEAIRRTIVLARQSDEWFKLFQQGVGDAPAASPLRGDDTWTDGYPISHAVWHSISAGIDNLHAYRVMTVSGGPTDYQVSTYPYGGYPPLRAALENAALGTWLMRPDSRKERITRYLAWWSQEAFYYEKSLELRGATERSRPKIREWVSAVAAERGISHSSYATFPKFSDMVREAAESVGMTPDVGELVWRTMSGMAHGERWASLTLNEMEEIERLPGTDNIRVLTTTPIGRLCLFAEFAARYLRGALDLQAQRRTPPF